jgi:hypothetical protein
LHALNIFKKNKNIFRYIGWFFLANSLTFWILGSGYLKAILFSSSLFENTVVMHSNLLGKFFIILFALANYFSHMMLLAFTPAIVLFLFACIAPYRRLIMLLSILLAVFSIVCLIADTRIYAMFKFHINPTVLAFVFSPQWQEVFDFSRYELIIMSSAMAVIFIIEGLIAWFVWNKIILAKRFQVGKTITIFWLGGIVFSYLTLLMSMDKNFNIFSQQTPNLPLFNQLFVHIIPDKNAQDILMRYSEQSFSQPLFSKDPLHYPLHSMQCKAPKKPYNIILIMVDSLRFDSMQSQYMPNVSKFATKSWQFQHHSSGGNATQPGVFTLFYGIPSNYWTAALEQKKPPVLMDLLLKYGYDTQIFWSMEMYNPPFNKTIYTQLKNLPLDGAPGKDIGSWDRHTTQKAIEFLTARNEKNSEQKKPFYLNLFYDAPHGFCSDQSYDTPYQPTHKQCSRITMSNDVDPVPYYNRYLNAVNFIDEEVGKVLNTIESQGYLENSIVIFTSDHGQEFNDNHQNYWGHAGNFTETQMHVPFVIYWPGEKPEKIEHVTSGYDFTPTMLTRLFDCKNPVSDYSIGQNLFDKERQLPFLLVGSYINMGIIEPDRLTTLETSGRVNITTQNAATIPDAKPRRETINQALRLMRKYF